MIRFTIFSVLFLFSFSCFSQGIDDSQIAGVWNVNEVKLNFPDNIKPEKDKIDLLKQSFMGAKFMFSEDKLFKIEMSKDASGPFSDEMFSGVFQWRLDGLKIKVGTDTSGYNIMHIDVLEIEDDIYFSLVGNIVLKVEKTTENPLIDASKLIQEKDTIRSEKLNKKGDFVYKNLEDTKVIPFELVDEIPVTKDCNPKWKGEKLKKCVTRSIRMHMLKKFNTDLAANKGLSGTLKMNNSFIIDKEGHIINITSEAPHIILEEEAKRVLSLLPSMRPARHNGEIVSVKYSIPLTFKIVD